MAEQERSLDCEFFGWVQKNSRHWRVLTADGADERRWVSDVWKAIVKKRFNDLNEAGSPLNEAQSAVSTKLAERFRKLFINGFCIETKCFTDPEKLHHIQPPLPVLYPPVSAGMKVV